MSTKMYLKDAKLIMTVHCGDGGLLVCNSAKENEDWANRFLQNDWIEISPNQSKVSPDDSLVVYRFKREPVRRAADIIIGRLPN